MAIISKTNWLQYANDKIYRLVLPLAVGLNLGLMTIDNKIDLESMLKESTAESASADSSSQHPNPILKDGWYIQPVVKSPMELVDKVRELEYRDANQLQLAISNEGVITLIGQYSNMRAAYDKMGHLSGVFSKIRLIEVEEGQAYIRQTFDIQPKTDFSRDSRGGLGIPRGVDILVDQEVRYHNKNVERNPMTYPIQGDKVNTNVVKGLIAVESNFNPNAEGENLVHVGDYVFRKARDENGNPIKSGARGLGQITPIAWEDIGMDPNAYERYIDDPRMNIRAATRFLSRQLRLANGDYSTALKGYNKGHEGIKSNPYNPEAVNHANKVLEAARKFNSFK